MNVVNVNGKTYKLPDGNVSVINNKIYHNGKLVVDVEEIKEKNINIEISGDACNVSLDCGNITVKGNCKDVTNTNGDIIIKGDVLGNTKTTNGDIKCKHINGCAETVNGNINGKEKINKSNYTYSTCTINKKSIFKEIFEDIFG